MLYSKCLRQWKRRKRVCEGTWKHTGARSRDGILCSKREEQTGHAPAHGWTFDQQHVKEASTEQDPPRDSTDGKFNRGPVKRVEVRVAGSWGEGLTRKEDKGILEHAGGLCGLRGHICHASLSRTLHRSELDYI